VAGQAGVRISSAAIGRVAALIRIFFNKTGKIAKDLFADSKHFTG